MKYQISIYWLIPAIGAGYVLGWAATHRRCRWWRMQVEDIYYYLRHQEVPSVAAVMETCRKALGLEDGK